MVTLLQRNIQDMSCMAHGDETNNNIKLALKDIHQAFVPTECVLSIRHLCHQNQQMIDRLSRSEGQSRLCTAGKQRVNDLLKHSVPNAWRNQMNLHGFKCVEKTKEDVIKLN